MYIYRVLRVGHKSYKGTILYWTGIIRYVAGMAQMLPIVTQQILTMVHCPHLSSNTRVSFCTQNERTQKTTQK